MEKMIEIAAQDIGLEESLGRNMDPGFRILEYLAQAKDRRVIQDLGERAAYQQDKLTLGFGDHYCAAAISCWAFEAGLPLDHEHGRGFYSCGHMVDWLQSLDKWSDPEDRPERGNLVFLKNGSGQVYHVELLEEVRDLDGDLILTVISPNYGSKVARIKRKVSDGEISGYGEVPE